MVVVAIISALVAIALPAYQNYVVRARISEALTLAGGLKATVAVNAAQATGDLSLGSSLVMVGSRNVVSTEVDAASGAIMVITTAKAGNGIILLTPTESAGTPLMAGTVPAGNIVWVCTSTMPQKFLPSSCVGA